MTVLGFSSGATGKDSNTDRMVRATLNQLGEDAETEFVKLTDCTFSACKGCVHICSKRQVCGLKDEVQPYYERIKSADAVVFGAPIYGGTINVTMQAFIERFFGYSHVTMAVEDKPVVLIACGHRDPAVGLTDFERLMKQSRLDVRATLGFTSESPPCLSCGRHRECSIGALYGRLGVAAHTTKVTPDMFLRWEECAEAVEQVRLAAEALRN